jgi:hypothetical protein
MLVERNRPGGRDSGCIDSSQRIRRKLRARIQHCSDEHVTGYAAQGVELNMHAVEKCGWISGAAILLHFDARFQMRRM